MIKRTILIIPIIFFFLCIISVSGCIGKTKGDKGAALDTRVIDSDNKIKDTPSIEEKSIIRFVNTEAPPDENLFFHYYDANQQSITYQCYLEASEKMEDTIKLGYKEDGKVLAEVNVDGYMNFQLIPFSKMADSPFISIENIDEVSFTKPSYAQVVVYDLCGSLDKEVIFAIGDGKTNIEVGIFSYVDDCESSYFKEIYHFSGIKDVVIDGTNLRISQDTEKGYYVKRFEKNYSGVSERNTLLAPEEVLNQYLLELKKYDFSNASKYVLEESVKYRYGSIEKAMQQLRSNYDLHLYEIVEINEVQIKEFPSIIDHPEIEMLLGQYELDYYYDSEHRKDSFYAVLVNDKDNGWKISYDNYINNVDLGFRESRVKFSNYPRPRLTNEPTVKICLEPITYTLTGAIINLNIQVHEDSIYKGKQLMTKNDGNAPTQIYIQADDTFFAGTLDEKNGFKVGDNTFTVFVPGLLNSMKINMISLNSLINNTSIGKPKGSCHAFSYIIYQNGEFLNEQTVIKCTEIEGYEEKGEDFIFDIIEKSN